MQQLIREMKHDQAVLKKKSDDAFTRAFGEGDSSVLGIQEACDSLRERITRLESVIRIVAEHVMTLGGGLETSVPKAGEVSSSEHSSNLEEPQPPQLSVFTDSEGNEFPRVEQTFSTESEIRPRKKGTPR